MDDLSDTVLRSFEDASAVSAGQGSISQQSGNVLLMSGLVQTLQGENEKLRSDYVELQRSSGEMKILLRDALSESEVGRELHRVLAEHEKLLKRVDMFKVEKAHLVDNILELSTEVDELQRTSVLKLATRLQNNIKYADFDQLLHKEKSVMGTKIVEYLKSKNADTQLVREVASIVATALSTPYESSQVDSAVRTGSIDISVFSQKSTSVSSPSGKSRRNSKTGHRKGSRKQDYLDRDENESIISSVSTHRQRPVPQSPTGYKSNITKAALARLDRLNDGELDDEDEEQGETSFLPKDVVNFFSGFFT